MDFLLEHNTERSLHSHYHAYSCMYFVYIWYTDFYGNAIQPQRESERLAVIMQFCLVTAWLPKRKLNMWYSFRESETLTLFPLVLSISIVLQQNIREHYRLNNRNGFNKVAISDDPGSVSNFITEYIGSPIGVVSRQLK